MKEAKHHLFERLRRELGDSRVIQAMERVPRERFIPALGTHLAYEDTALPIGEGQTISQPYIVAMMIGALELRRTDKVLEIGTGSGYQAAILAELAAKVVSVERLGMLAVSARERLGSLGYTNVEVLMAEEGLGWPKEAPYDAIVVAAGTPRLPRELIEQLTIGGRLVVPVGSMDLQELMKIVRTADSFSVRTMVECQFVPLIGEGAWP